MHMACKLIEAQQHIVCARDALALVWANMDRSHPLYSEIRERVLLLYIDQLPDGLADRKYGSDGKCFDFDSLILRLFNDGIRHDSTGDHRPD